MKFKNYIETESGIKDTSTSPGAAGQVLSSTVTGTSWIDPDTLVSAASKLVVIACKNVSGTPILKGTPVYQSGTVGATDVIEVEPANATISTGYLPAIGILQTTLNNNGFGNVVITGEFLNYSTADIPTDRPGGDPFTGDTVYLAAGGGLTCIKPTGAGNAIQNLGLVGKVSGGNAGSITVASIMRANDVPNLPEGRIWIGDGNTIVSDTVYVDEPNNRVGIGTTSPNAKLEVNGTIDVNDRGDKVFVADGSDGTFSLGDLDGLSNEAQIVGDANTIKINNGGNTTLTSTFTNRIGIGTTSPGDKLVVQGDGDGILVRSNDFTLSRIIPRGQTSTNWDKALFSLYNAAAENVRIDTAGSSWFNGGNVGIGTTSPLQKLHVTGSGYFQNGNVFVGSTSNTMFNYISTFVILAGSSQTIALGGGPGNVNNNVLIGNGNLSVSGNVGIGTTSPTQKLHVVGRVASTAGNGFQIINSYGSPWLSDFYGSFTTSSPLYVGGPYSGQACYASAFNITSDYRLKENEVPLTEASSRIKKLKPIRFNYISSENTVDGFLAHEVGEVIPEAVTGEKDAVREDGSDELQGLDLSKIVPLLTAALQETITKIEQLEQRIKTLENK